MLPFATDVGYCIVPRHALEQFMTLSLVVAVAVFLCTVLPTQTLCASRIHALDNVNFSTDLTFCVEMAKIHAN